MKEYLIVLEFRVAISDLTKEAKQSQESAARKEAVEVHQRRLASIKAAELTKKGGSK